MDNKKLGYRNEKKDFKFTIGYFLFFLAITIISYVSKDTDAPYIIFFGIVVFFSLIIFGINLKYYFNYQKNKKIKMNGQRLTGHINSFEYGITSKNMRARYRLVVTYANPVNNQQIVYVTPVVDFDVISDLGSRMCNVYIWNDDVYVSDYVVRNRNQPYVWDEDVIRQYNPTALLKAERKELFEIITGIALVVTIILVLFSLII